MLVGGVIGGGHHLAPRGVVHLGGWGARYRKRQTQAFMASAIGPVLVVIGLVVFVVGILLIGR